MYCIFVIVKGIKLQTCLDINENKMHRDQIIIGKNVQNKKKQNATFYKQNNVNFLDACKIQRNYLHLHLQIMKIHLKNSKGHSYCLVKKYR